MGIIQGASGNDKMRKMHGDALLSLSLKNIIKNKR